MAKITIFLVSLVLVTCHSESFHFIDHEYDRTPFGDTIDRASMKMLQETYKSADDKNVIASPLGVFELLSLYSAGAPGRVRDEIVQFLGGSNYSQMLEGYSSLSEQFSRYSPEFLTLANKIYVSDKFNLETGHFSEAVQRLHSEVQTADFSKPKAAVDAINHWAEEKTHGHIKKALDDDAIDESVAVALFNVIFMQGHWNVPFEAKDTKEENFYLLDKSTVKKDMMHLHPRALFYHENVELGAKFIELPYKEQNFRMVVVLPNDIDGLPAVMEKAEHGLLADIFSLEPSNVEIEFFMPKFEIETGLNLNSLLPKLGVSAIFSDPASEIVRESSVRVSKAFQKAFIKVDEEGATAGAFTGAIAIPTSSLYVPPPPTVIKVDHPFLFLILYEDKILFTGTYAH